MNKLPDGIQTIVMLRNRLIEDFEYRNNNWLYSEAVVEETKAAIKILTNILNERAGGEWQKLEYNNIWYIGRVIK